MSGIRRLPVRDSSKSSFMMMRYERNCEFDAGCSYLELLPLELQEKIFRMLSNSDIRHLTLVSKTIFFTVCESYALMSRFKIVMPNLEVLKRYSKFPIMARKYSNIKFPENITYGDAAKILSYVNKFADCVQNATFLKFAYSDLDFLEIVSAFSNLKEMSVHGDYDFDALNDPKNQAWNTATQEQVEQWYTSNKLRLSLQYKAFTLQLHNLHSLKVNVNAKFSKFMAAKLKHLEIWHHQFEVGLTALNVLCFLEYQSASLVSLSLVNYRGSRLYSSKLFSNDKISRINLTLKELVLKNFVLEGQQTQLMNVIGFIHSQQGTLQCLKLIRCNFLAAQSFTAFIVAASQVKKLVIDSCADLSWLPLYLASDGVRLDLLLIKNSALAQNVRQSIDDHRQNIGQLLIQ